MIWARIWKKACFEFTFKNKERQLIFQKQKSKSKQVVYRPKQICLKKIKLDFFRILFKIYA